MSSKAFVVKTAVLLSFILFIIAALSLLNLSFYLNSQGLNGQPVTVLVNPGISVNKVGRLLEEKKLIKDSRFFWLIYRMFYFKKPMISGEYLIPPYASAKQIINLLQQGRIIIHKITFPEGITTGEIIKLVQNESALDGEIATQFAEGVFLPDTYNFTYGESKMALLSRIIMISKTKTQQLWDNRQPDLPFSNIAQAITLAAIIEKETSLKAEKPRVASVFINRLKKDMKLQADPTVNYAITEGKYILERSLTLKDLKFDSPYNTYLYKGLPPGPIANPGIDSIKAVLNPIKSDDLFFVVDGKGGHNFSNSLDEHNKNVKSFRNGFKNE